jgi:hypothetical protein
LSRGLTVLSRNLGDFGKVPGLVVEDWTAQLRMGGLAAYVDKGGLFIFNLERELTPIFRSIYLR